jgi:hypothetical protein
MRPDQKHVKSPEPQRRVVLCRCGSGVLMAHLWVKAFHPAHYGNRAGAIPLLDILVIMKGTTMVTNAYRKPIHTRRYLNLNPTISLM